MFYTYVVLSQNQRILQHYSEKVFNCCVRTETSLTLSISRLFAIVTGHVPLQWLSTQKMEELPRWALALQNIVLSRQVHPDNNHIAMTTQEPTL